MSDAIKPSEYSLKNLISEAGYMVPRQKELVFTALSILISNHGSLTESHVNTMLKHLEDARLISSSSRQAVVKKLFAK